MCLFLWCDHVVLSGVSRDCRDRSGFPVPRPGSIFPGRFVHELRWDCNGIPDCNWIVRIVCHSCCGRVSGIVVGLLISELDGWTVSRSGRRVHEDGSVLVVCCCRLLVLLACRPLPWFYIPRPFCAPIAMGFLDCAGIAVGLWIALGFYHCEDMVGRCVVWSKLCYPVICRSIVLSGFVHGL